MKVQQEDKAKLISILGQDKIFLLLLIIFICKGVFYAFVIIPATINTTADDFGHLSYIQYIASEKKLPVLNEVGLEKTAAEEHGHVDIGQQEIDVDSWIQDSKFNYNMENGRNWIVQHPPLYYGITGILYSICSTYTNNTAVLILVIRCFSIMLGVITLIYMNKSISLLNFSKLVKYVAIILVVFSPAAQYYFASMSNDTLVICISAVALYYLLDYIQSDTAKSFYIMVILCAAIIWTKYTGGLIVLAYALVYLYHVLTTKDIRKAILLTVKGALLGVLLLLPLFCFNLYHYGSIFVVANEQTKIYNFEFLYFLKELGYIRELFPNFIAFLGWQVFLRPNDFQVFLMTCFILGMALISYKNYNVTTKAKNISLYGSFIMFYLIYSLESGLYCAVCGASLFVIVVKSIMGISKSEEEGVKFYNKINRYMVIMIIIVVGIFAYQHYAISLHKGKVTAIHGRYYYIILVPFLYLLTHALQALSRKHQKYVLITTLILTITCEINLLLKCIERWSW